MNKFNHKNKIGKLKFNDISDLINNVKSNTISKANAKKKINELNKIKEVETKGRRLIDSQKTLLSLFDDLKTIFNNNNNNSNNNNESDSNNKNKNENEKDHIEIKRDKMFEQDKYSKLVIQPPHKRDDLLDTVTVILEFNKTIQPYLT